MSDYNISLSMRNARIPKKYQDVSIKLSSVGYDELKPLVEKGSSVAIFGGAKAMDVFYLLLRGNVIKGRTTFCASLAELEGYLDGVELFDEVGQRLMADNFDVLGIRCFQESEDNPYKPVNLGRISTFLTDFMNRGGILILHNSMDKPNLSAYATWKWHPKFLADMLKSKLENVEVK